jgi:hypothetical protein
MLRIRGMMGRMQEHLHIFVNGRVFHDGNGVRELMTGAEIADLVGVPVEQTEVRLEAKIDAKHLRIDTFSSDPGEQHLNTTYSAVRVTHIPSGLVISKRDEESQLKNRTEAMRELRERLYESGQAQQRSIGADERILIEDGDQFSVTSL